MKKFTKILICLMLCVFSIGFVACDKRSAKEKNFVYPSANDLVVGNGGLAVKKGNYVYFVNGYKSVSQITNKKDTYTVGSLMLMRLGQDGNVVTDDNGLVKDEYFITMSDKLCGYEATNLFIHGDYLYFVTPCLENESGDKVWAKERVVFNRIKLDKTGNVEEIYSSGVKYNQLEYQYYQENGNLFILAWEKGGSYYSGNGNNALVRINATAKSSSVIANDVTSVAFAENYNEVFFVQSGESYSVKQLNVASGNVKNYTTFDKTFTVKFVADGNVYGTMAHDYGETTDVMVANIENKSGFELLHAYEGEAKLSITPDGSAVVVVSENTISLVTENKKVTTIVDEDVTTINIIGYTNGCVVYYGDKDSNSVVKMVSYYNYLNDGDKEIRTLTTLSTFEQDYAYFDLDADESYLYFFKKENSNYYLNRLKVNNNIDETEEMFGVYLAEDVPEVEDKEPVEE